MGLPSWLITTHKWQLLASVWILDHLLKYGYDNKVLWDKNVFMPSNAFFFLSVNLNATFYDVSVVRGCDKCDHMPHMSI